MGALHQDERSFWKTANPRRLQALLDALFQPDRAQTAEKQQKISLSEYLTTGGG